MHRVWGKAHIFHATGNNNFAVACADGGEAVGNGTQTGTTNLVHGIGSTVFADASGDGGLACGAHALGGGEYVTHNHFIDFITGCSGAGQRRFDRLTA